NLSVDQLTLILSGFGVNIYDADSTRPCLVMQSQNPYDTVRYYGKVHPLTAPLHLAFISLYFGGPKASLTQYRVMELGCGDGSNLIPLAFYSPECEFIGIDNSARQLNAAQEKVDSLQLTNIQFEQLDVENLSPQDCGEFDYIIAHGLFSWIKEEARRAVLSFCHGSLASSGLAYICYNAMPGWSIRGTLRDILRGSRKVCEASTSKKAEAAQSVIRELYEDLPSRDHAFGDLMAREFEYILSAEPFYVQHEYLAEENQPYWISEFVQMATEHGLEYVGDAQFGKPEGRLPQGISETLASRSLSVVEQEERADLLSQRTLRASVLCRKNAPRSSISRRQLLDEVFNASDLAPVSDPFNMQNGVVEKFYGRSAVEITLDESVTKAAILQLSTCWPLGMKFETLLTKATQMLREIEFPVPGDAEKTLESEITELLTLGEVEWRLREPVDTSQPFIKKR
ncbi:MAG: class I SAM-dependent methyltransferase, partial [Deltaproteobacteria bacterium]|nr:class I SAM-dependent methyltransferase [Deltaproteobacteria bacterium]